MLIFAPRTWPYPGIGASWRFYSEALRLPESYRTTFSATLRWHQTTLHVSLRDTQRIGVNALSLNFSGDVVDCRYRPFSELISNPVNTCVVIHSPHDSCPCLLLDALQGGSFEAVRCSLRHIHGISCMGVPPCRTASGRPDHPRELFSLHVSYLLHPSPSSAYISRIYHVPLIMSVDMTPRFNIYLSNR